MNTPDALTDVDQDATVNLFSPSLVATDLPGDRYEILEYVNSGGSGAIYKGRHILLDKIVAIKMLNHESAEHLMRFQQEAKALAKLSHPNIIQVLEFGANTKGEPYLVMDWFDGCSLKEHLAKLGPMPLSEAIPLLVKVARAIGAAHRQGILHRDIKPGNIMVARTRDGDLEAKLVDFGIAKDIGDKPSSTQSGAAIGTPLYMSPEQAGGKKISVQSDLYSFGCVMFEIFTGHPPFEAESTVEVLQKHRSEQPPKLKTKNKKVAVPPHIEDLIYSLLSKNPPERPMSADEVIAILESDGKEQRQKRSPHRKTIVIRSAIAAVVLLVAAAIAYEISGIGIVPKEIKKVWDKKQGKQRRPSVPETLTGLTTLTSSRAHEEASKARPTQKFVNWSAISMDDRTLETEVSSHFQIEELVLAANPITDQGLKALANLPLKDLNVSYTAVTGSGLVALKQPTLLRRLNLNQCFATNKSLNTLARFRNLENLNIRANQEVSDLSIASKLPNLKILIAGGLKIGHKGLLPLHECKSLEHLNLSGTKLTAQMIDVIASLESVQILDLSNTGLTAESISPLAKMPRLTAINLDGNQVTTETLLAIGSCPSLREIHVSEENNKLTRQDLAAFHARYPRCRVIIYSPEPTTNLNLPFMKSILEDFKKGASESKSKQKSKIAP